jgi:signal transduction histidine kinase
VRGVLRETASACEARGGGILLLDEDDPGLDLFFWDAEKPDELRHEVAPSLKDDRPWGSLGEAMRRNEPVRALVENPDLGPPKNERELPDFGIISALSVPLEGVDGPVMGSLALYNKSDGRAFDDDDVELLRLIAANFCTAVRLFRSRVRREREERLSTIGSLLSSVVHDLKSPMAVISGCVQMLTQADDPKKRKEYGELVMKQFDLIAAMQREVLEFARGERRVLVRKVYVGKFFEDLGTARFDQGKLTRVIHNLARNAIEAMGEGGGELTLRVRRAPSKKGAAKGGLVIEVSDTGPGIPKQIESKIFQSFVTAGKKGGTGLGLAIVKKIVEEHGGTVEVHSTARGTTFTIVLPQNDSSP